MNFYSIVNELNKKFPDYHFQIVGNVLQVFSENEEWVKCYALSVANVEKATRDIQAKSKGVNIPSSTMEQLEVSAYTVKQTRTKREKRTHELTTRQYMQSVFVA